jgi:hypothetical protein
MIDKFRCLNVANKYALMLGSKTIFEFSIKESCEDLFLVDSGKTIGSEEQFMFIDEKYTIVDLGCFNTDSYTAGVKTAAFQERTAAERVKERIVIPEGFLRRIGAEEYGGTLPNYNNK